MRTLFASLVCLAACGGSSGPNYDFADIPVDMAGATQPDATAVVDLGPDLSPDVPDQGLSSTGDMTVEDTLTVNNTIHWCTVTVTVGNESPVTFSTTNSMTFKAAPGTTVQLKADPNPNFFPVEWTGVTTMSGDTATYVMSNAAQQSVTACCPTNNMGGGCS